MKNIAIVCGGYSKEEVISLKSAQQIAQVVDKHKFNVYTVLINKSQWVVKLANIDLPIDKNDFSFINNDIQINFDAVFMAIHGTPGEDGKLQSYFEMIGIPLTTCNSFVSALTFNKHACKLYLKNYGIPSAQAIVLYRGQEFCVESIIDKLQLPIFVKPNNGGSSFGITKVKQVSELLPAINKAFAEDNQIIIEEFIDGREFTCGVFKSSIESIVMPITEIVSETEFFDYKAKYEGLSDEITPARLSADETTECQALTSKIYDVLNCTGMVRIDFLQRNNEFYFMEVNTVPGMSKESLIPQQTEVYGLPVKELYTKLIEDALQRGVD